jgi:alanyl-tRNA synthetase
MTDRLYYHDSYLTRFEARVLDVSPERHCIYLDRTAFYPTSGGQPFDTGRLAGIEVEEVIDEESRIAHLLREPLLETLVETEITGLIDWPRRFDHMQQHTGQHLLSAILIDMFDAPTVSFHLGAEASTIDIGRTLDSDELRRAEHRANEIVFENRPVAVTYQDSTEDLALRKPTEREGAIRIVSIKDLDRSACGGTHVRATGEIGPILIRKLDRIRGNMRIEFLCGMRAVERARADYEALSEIARAFSAPLDETPALMLAQREKLQESEKARRRISTELAQASGRELYERTAPDPDGIRRVERRVESLSDDVRSEAQSFTGRQKSIFLALGEDPPSLLLAVSQDSGLNAGALLKQSLGAAGGRGGGSAVMAQGSAPSKAALDETARGLLASLGFPQK